MTLYKTTDSAGYESIHNCSNEEIAKQAHLLHYGLISVNFLKIEILEGNIEPCYELGCLSYIEELEHNTNMKE